MQVSEMLESVRTCVNDLGVKNAAVKDVLAEAKSHGWVRLVASMSNERQAALIRMLAEDHQATHAVLETVVPIYERIIEELVAAAERELDVVLGETIERAHGQRGWLGLLAAGGVGYWIGKEAKARWEGLGVLRWQQSAVSRGWLVHNADDSLHLPNLRGAELEPSAKVRKRLQFSLCRCAERFRVWTLSGHDEHTQAKSSAMSRLDPELHQAPRHPSQHHPFGAAEPLRTGGKLTGNADECVAGCGHSEQLGEDTDGLGFGFIVGSLPEINQSRIELRQRFSDGFGAKEKQLGRFALESLGQLRNGLKGAIALTPFDLPNALHLHPTSASSGELCLGETVPISQFPDPATKLFEDVHETMPPLSMKAS